MLLALCGGRLGRTLQTVAATEAWALPVARQVLPASSSKGLDLCPAVAGLSCLALLVVEGGAMCPERNGSQDACTIGGTIMPGAACWISKVQSLHCCTVSTLFLWGC